MSSQIVQPATSDEDLSREALLEELRRLRERNRLLEAQRGEAGLFPDAHSVDVHRYRSVLDNLKEVVFQTDAAGRWTYLNPAWTEMTGFSVEESLGVNFLNYVHSDDRQRNIELFEPLIRREKDSCRHEIRYLTKDGGSRWIEVYARLTIDRDGSVIGTSGTLKDITDRKQAEASLQAAKEALELLVAERTAELLQANADLQQELAQRRAAEIALQRSEARFRAIVEQAGVGVVQADLDGRLVFVNQGYCDLLGYSREELLQKRFQDLTHPEDLADNLALVNRLLETRRSFNMEKRYLRKDGSVVWVDITVSLVEDVDGNVLALVGIAEDITERRHYRETLQFLVDASTLLSSSLDAEQILITLARLAVPRLADWSVVHLVQDDGSIRRLVLVHTDPEKERLLDTFSPTYPRRSGVSYGPFYAIETGRSQLVPDVSDVVLESMAGSARHLALLQALGMHSLVSVPIIVQGRAVGAISFISAGSGRRFTPADLSLAEDLARRTGLMLMNALLYQEAQQAIQLRDEFLSVAAHELKTPVASLLGHAQLLHRRAQREQLPERVISSARLIGEQAQRLNRLMSMLLDFSRLQAGHLMLEPGTLDLTQLVRRVATTMQPLLQHHALELRLPVQPLLLLGDETRLEQVLSNLVANAVKYSAADTVITIEVECRDSQALIAISDHGVGIPAAALPHIFNRFYRAGNIDPNVIGLGIGLYLVKEIITLHGGTIAIDSTEGEGTTVTISLPCLNNNR